MRTIKDMKEDTNRGHGIGMIVSVAEKCGHKGAMGMGWRVLMFYVLCCG